LSKARDTDGLLEILQSAEPKSFPQIAAVEALGKVGYPRAVSPLLHLLDADGVSRLDAIIALSRIGNVEAEDRLIAALDDDFELIRTKAAEGLWKMRSRRAIPGLIRMLDSDVYPERLTAACALAEIGDPSVNGRLQAVRQHERLPWRRRRFPARVTGSP